MHHNAYLGPTACTLSFAQRALVPSVKLLSESVKKRKTRKRDVAERAVAQGSSTTLAQFCSSVRVPRRKACRIQGSSEPVVSGAVKLRTQDEQQEASRLLDETAVSCGQCESANFPSSAKLSAAEEVCPSLRHSASSHVTE